MASVQCQSNQGRYILLEVWEVSADKDTNTSVVGWKATTKGDYSGTWKYTHDTFITINGETVYSYYADPWNSTPDSVKAQFPICKGKSVSGEKTIQHNDDGSKSISFSLTTGILVTSSTTYTGSLALTDFDLGSSSGDVYISSLAGGVLGQNLEVKWTPTGHYQSFYLRYTYPEYDAEGNVTGSTEVKTATINGVNGQQITENILLQYGLANAVPSGISGTFSLELVISDPINGDATVTQEVRFTVPDNAETKPTITAVPFVAEPSYFGGVFIQNLTKIAVSDITAQGKYRASVSRRSFRFEGVEYLAPSNLTTESIVQNGTLTGRATAVDSRGFTSESFDFTVNVIPYSKPKLKAAQGQNRPRAERCDEDGTLNEKGTWLKIMAKREYSPVVYEEEQKNFCAIRYRWKPDTDAGWSAWTVILAADAQSDEVITAPLLGTLSSQVTYLVEIQAVDTLEETGSTVITVSTEKVYDHEHPALGSYGFGERVSEENVFSISMDKLLRIRGQLILQGDALAYLLDICHPIGSVLETVNSENPGTYLGGTWAALDDTENTHKWRRTE